MADLGTLLQGISAGLSGNLPQFNAMQDQRKLMQAQMQEQEQQKRQTLSRERYAAMVQDAYQLQKLTESGKFGAAIKLLDNRINAINELGGDPSDSIRVKGLLVSGDPAQYQQFQRGLQETIDAGAVFWQPPEAAKMTPYEQEKAKLARDKFEWQKQNPNAGTQGAMGTANQRDWETYQQLLKTNPSEAEAFGRAAGFESREGQQLSSYAEKQIDMASTEAAQANSDSNRYLTLADQIKQSAMSGGIQSTWGEYIKEQTGNQDEVTALRKQVMQIVNSEAVKNLPPGPATDRDIEMVRSPFPTEKAAPEYIANWLGAVARLNQKRAEFSEFKANFISENGSLRTRSGESMISAWKRQQEQQQKQTPKGATPGIAPAAATGNEPSLDDLLSMY